MFSVSFQNYPKISSPVCIRISQVILQKKIVKYAKVNNLWTEPFYFGNG